MDHPVGRHLELIGSVGGNADCWALELPADEPVLVIAGWLRAGVAGPSGTCALVAVKDQQGADRLLSDAVGAMGDGSSQPTLPGRHAGLSHVASRGNAAAKPSKRRVATSP